MATKFGQKFTTTFISDGCRIHVIQDNTYNHDGTIPTHLLVQLFTWNSTYTDTISGATLVSEDVVVASEEVEDTKTWIYIMWTPLPIGSYLWLLTVQSDASHDKDVFQLIYDPDSTKFDSFEDASNTPIGGDFESEIFQLGSDIYESALSIGDTFGTYQTSGGNNNVKINRGSLIVPNYVNSIKTQDAVTDGSRKIGRIASGSLVKII